MDIHVTSSRVFHDWIYQVWVDGKVYDTLFTRKWITQSQMDDIAAGYREYLEFEE